MRSVHREVFTLLEQWRDELDAAELTVPIDLPALRARQRFEALPFPTVADVIAHVPGPGFERPAFPAIAAVVDTTAAISLRPDVAPRPVPAWIPDELYPYPAAG